MGRFNEQVWEIHPSVIKLVEVEVAQQYGVSRPTARSAITALVREGLLRREANKPAQVPTLTRAHVGDLFRIRIPLEEQVLRYVIDKRSVPVLPMTTAIEELRGVAPDAPHSAFVLPDLLFHSVLVGAVGSSLLSNIYDLIRGGIHLGMVQTRTALGRDRILEEHSAILTAATDGDADTAVHLMHDHLQGAYRALHKQLA